MQKCSKCVKMAKIEYLAVKNRPYSLNASKMPTFYLLSISWTLKIMVNGFTRPRPKVSE